MTTDKRHYQVFGAEDLWVSGRLYGFVEKGRLRWCKLDTAPPHHVENCDCLLCWQVVWPDGQAWPNA